MVDIAETKPRVPMKKAHISKVCLGCGYRNERKSRNCKGCGMRFRAPVWRRVLNYLINYGRD